MSSPSHAVWKRIPIGGGYTVGIVIHPADDAIKYCRTDVSGAYRWNEATQEWEQMMTGDALPKQAKGYETFNGATALALDPTNKDIVYAAFGYRASVLLRSTNRGHSWTYLNFQTNFLDKQDRGVKLASDYDRMHGERMAVDPKNPKVVYFGTFLNGLARTLDATKGEGATWETLLSGAQPQNDKDPNDNPTASLTGKDTVPKVVFDPSSPVVDGRSARIYANVWRKGVFRTQDGGKTWTNLCGGEGAPPTDKYWHDLKVTSNGTVYLLAGSEDTPTDKNGSCLWKLENQKWTNITPAMQTTRNQTEVDIDPSNEKHIIVFEAGGLSRRAFDGGQGPNSFGWGDTADYSLTAKDVPWLGWVKPVWGTGSAAFDSKGALWMGEGTGIWRTDNAFANEKDGQKNTIRWTSVTAGQESFMPRALVAIPGKDQLSIGTLDKIGVTSTDFSNYPGQTWDKDHHSDTHCLEYSGQNPLFQVKMTKRWGFDLTDYSGYSEDGGLTWTRFGAAEKSTTPDGLTWGSIAVAAKNTKNLVWASRTTGKLAVSHDRGDSWRIVDFAKAGLDPKWGTGEYSFGWDVWHAPMFATGDRVQDGTFYVYQQRPGSDASGKPRPTLLITRDGGQSWSGSSAIKDGSYHGKLNAVPSQAGHVFFAYGGDLDGGLFQSKDFGKTAQALGGFTRASCVGFGQAAPGKTYPAIYTQALKDGQWGVFRSIDGGQSFQKISDYPLGINQNIAAMTGDMARYGRVYAAFAAYGVAYADVK